MRRALPLVTLALAACVTPASLPPGQAIGEPIVRRDPVRFAVVDANPQAYFERTLLVEASIVAVCQKVGCWMQVEDEGRTAMVRWETGCGGQYAFPPGAVGRRVLIQGTLHPRTLSADEIEHLREEAGQDVAFRAEGYEFNASAILVPDERG
jgi:hypothetical protein